MIYRVYLGFRPLESRGPFKEALMGYIGVI